MSSQEYRDYLKDRDPTPRNADRDAWDDPYIQAQYERHMRGDFRSFQEIMSDLRRERNDPENWVYPKRPPGI